MVAVSYQFINAFATKSNGGNPAAVVVLPSQNTAIPSTTSDLKTLYPPDAELQDIAKRLDRPMTAFVVPLKSGDEPERTGSYGLRWFNPVTEAWLCGHATMATSALLFSQHEALETIEYTTMKYGILRARRTARKGDKLEDIEIGMEFPEITVIEPFSDSSKKSGTLDVLEGASGGSFKRENVVDMRDSAERVLVEVEAGFDLKRMKMDCQGLTPLTPLTIIFTQVVQSSQSSTNSDDKSEQIRSRVFVIVPGFAHEDMVTGSAHCLVVPYFLTEPAVRDRLFASTSGPPDTDDNNNDVLRVRQVSAGDGTFTAAWMKKEGKVRITGRCVAVENGTLG